MSENGKCFYENLPKTEKCKETHFGLEILKTKNKTCFNPAVFSLQLLLYMYITRNEYDLLVAELRVELGLGQTAAGRTLSPGARSTARKESSAPTSVGRLPARSLSWCTVSRAVVRRRHWSPRSKASPGWTFFPILYLLFFEKQLHHKTQIRDLFNQMQLSCYILCKFGHWSLMNITNGIVIADY